MDRWRRCPAQSQVYGTIIFGHDLHPLAGLNRVGGDNDDHLWHCPHHSQIHDRVVAGAILEVGQARVACGELHVCPGVTYACPDLLRSPQRY